MADKPRDTKFDSLIPELPTWNEGRGIDIESWIYCEGSHEHAIAYAQLFWPDFTVHHDCVFIEFDEQNYQGFMEQTGGDKRAVEAVMNHWHILQMFNTESDGPSEDQIVYLGRLLKETWACKLRRDFPDRHFTVSFPEGETEDLYDYEVTFFQRRTWLVRWRRAFAAGMSMLGGAIGRSRDETPVNLNLPTPPAPSRKTSESAPVSPRATKPDTPSSS